MKKLLGLLMAVIMTLSLAACGTQNTSQNISEETNDSTVVADSVQDTTADQGDDSGTEEAGSTEDKVLIVYFSPANADSVDVISSATPRVGDVSSVEFIAQKINEQVDADSAKIIPQDPYPVDYEETADRAKSEQDENARPEFTLDVNPEEYDVIFVGYSIWWYEMPMIMQTFFDTYDFSGKTIIPFNNHAGSRDGGTYEDIAELEPNATVLEGLAISGERAGDAESSVRDWLSKLGY